MSKITIKADNSLAEADDSGGVPDTRTINSGNGLTGGGDLSADRTISLGTPGTLTGSTINQAQVTSHTHEINLTAEDVGSPPVARTVSAGNGLTGGGSLAANRTIALGTPSTITALTGNSTTSTSHTHDLSISAADIGAAATSHTHSTSDIVSGTLPISRGGTGISTWSGDRYVRTSASGTGFAAQTYASVWSDIGPSARGVTQTWTGTQTFENQSYHASVVSDKAAQFHSASGTTSFSMNLDDNNYFLVQAINAGNTNVSFTAANALPRVFYIVVTGSAAGRTITWPSGVTVYPPGSGVGETSYTIPAGDRTVLIMLRISATEYYRVTG